MEPNLYELLAGVAGMVLSLLASYLPGWAPWYAALQSDYKRLIMLGLLAATAAAIYGLVCAGVALPGVSLACDQAGAVLLLRAFIAAMVANQATFSLTPKAQ